MGKTETSLLRGTKVAAYARVSVETDRLSHSLAAQREYYSRVIGSRPDWEFAGIYADNFISGTEAAHRPEFCRLMSDCESGRVDLVLCKSISRFARNTVDLLESIRRLKELGIEVRFEKENISSMSEEGELLLTILAGFAQEESRSVSENVKWGIRRRFQSGEAGIRNKCVFGYRFDGEKYVIREEEAETVREIFAEYIKGVPLRRIAEKLREKGVKTSRGFDFSHSQIDYIVRNEIYIGNIVLQKTFVKDFITHSKVENRGELPRYRLCDCHEPIVDRETFEAAQLARKKHISRRSVLAFSGKLICSSCGKPFTRRSNNGKYPCWHCRNCCGIKLKEKRLTELSGLSEEEIRERIFRITVSENGVLEVEYYEGRTERWQYE